MKNRARVTEDVRTVNDFGGLIRSIAEVRIHWTRSKEGRKYIHMTLTTIYLGDMERKALARLSRASGEKKSACLRLAIREAAARLEKRKAPARRARSATA